MATHREREAEDVKRRRIALSHFRKIVRMVILNREWLLDTSDQKFSLNVKRNIAMLVRQERKLGLLTLSHKTILRKNHGNRSIEERKKLVTLLSGLSCLASLPPKIRARLAPVIKFMNIGAGRTILRQGDPPNTVYFILSGEIDVSKRKYDKVTKSYTQKTMYIMGSGRILGNIGLLEETTRHYTYTSLTDVEMLVVYRDDFDTILRPVMSTDWDNKKTAIAALGYFHFMTKTQIAELCSVAILRQFEPLETIYYEDKSFTAYAYFLISGECMILQCLRMKVVKKHGIKSFELVNISKDSTNDMFQELSAGLSTNTIKVETKVSGKRFTLDMDTLLESDNDMQSDVQNKKILIRNMDVKSIMQACGVTTNSEHVKPPKEGESKDLKIVKENMESNMELEVNEELLEGTENSKSSMSTILYNGDFMEETDYNESDYNCSEESVYSSETMSYNNVESIEKKDNQGVKKVRITPTRIENHFIDVGSMTFGGVFGIGEKVEHRVIMARTTVQCIMVPRFGLFDKVCNPGNVWQRRRFYLDTTIPSRQTLFEDFLTTRKWQKFKTDLIDSILDPNINSNPTKVQDIPIICRIVEASDD